ncbi:MAG: hypothetical protein U0Y10_13300 [Spirosomataceae bacterium]
MNISICRYFGEPLSVIQSTKIVEAHSSNNLLGLLIDAFVYAQSAEDSETSEGSLEEAGGALWNLPQEFRVEIVFSSVFILNGLRHFSDYQETCLARMAKPTSPPPKAHIA